NLASELSGLQVPGQKMPAGSAPTPGRGSLLNRHRLWLPVGVAAALLLLVGMALLVAARRRPRRAGARKAEAARVGGGHQAGYEAVTESVSRWSPDADGDLKLSTFSDDYRALRPRTVRLPSQPASDWTLPGRADLVDEPLVDEIGDSAQVSDM